MRGLKEGIPSTSCKVNKGKVSEKKKNCAML